MEQLQLLKELLGNPPVSDAVLQFYLDNSRDIICDIRFSDAVETQYLTLQIKMAIEMFSKRGAEGQTGHSENGINRSYEKADISDSLIGQIIPVVRTPFSIRRVITQ